MSLGSTIPNLDLDKIKSVSGNLLFLGGFVGGFSTVMLTDCHDKSDIIKMTVGGSLLFGTLALSYLSKNSASLSETLKKRYALPVTLGLGAFGAFAGYTDAERRYQEYTQLQAAPLVSGNIEGASLRDAFCGYKTSGQALGQYKGQTVKVNCATTPPTQQP